MHIVGCKRNQGLLLQLLLQAGKEPYASVAAPEQSAQLLPLPLLCLSLSLYILKVGDSQ
jgi:hypothetical protein